MRNILKNRKALSTVVTTLIILVVSVLLAGVVTYYAINVTSTRVQEESLNIAYGHIWYSTGESKAEGAILITNTGGRDLVIDKIAVRGQACLWTSVYTNQTVPKATDPAPFILNLATNTTSAKLVSGTVTLKSGKTILLYLNSPDSITVNDVGLSIAISVFTAQAIYYKETNVQAELR
jgi:hypothetical protein